MEKPEQSQIMEKPEPPQIQHVEAEASSQEKEGFDCVDRKAIGGKDLSEMPRHYYRSTKVIGSLLAFMLAYEASFLSYVMVAGALTIIDNDIGPSEDLVWVILAITLGQAIAFPINGRLSDIFGRRWFFIGANVIAFVGYLVSSRAKTINTLIGGNILVGLGGAAQIAGSAVTGELVPNNKRFGVFVLITAGLAPVTALANAIGRSFCLDTDQGWRWIFYLLAIMTFSAIVLFLFFYFPPTFHHLHKGSSIMDTVKHIDYVGIVLYSGSAASLLLGISWGGQRYPWRSAQCIVTIVLGGIGMISIGFWDYFARPRHAFLPLMLLGNWNYMLLTVCSCAASMVFYALSILWPQQLVAVFGLSSGAAGWTACTLTSGVLLGWLISGPLVAPLSKFIYVKWQLVFSTALFTSFIGALAAADGSNLGFGIAMSLIGGSGIGYIETVCIAGAPLHLHPKDIGLANGAQYSLRTIFSSLSSSIYVTILNNKIASNMARYAFPAAIQAGLSQASAAALIQVITAGNQAAIAKIPGITPQAIEATVAGAQKAYFKSFQTVYYASIAFGLVAIIGAICVKGKLMQEKLTSEIARKLQHAGEVDKQDVEVSAEE
ncbi:uncharacterized protein A1O5_05634 [Cladophialophora psammophila CBS 110553]|uniref:Major facilitator superfamily (MFS) profile domain-containing protein n=1 Tax=Cladophialophora psammophila CBS 110553 TaxID=1182543 RepID=W9XNA3_9EURO|nr:uncharacterized protein A1O5_05634 [Cladophialophora psammophila CBS 110553]EXJ71824.1 hypothetical protein A1O5_05634 [Cladophialophora psammophila CBS 110553]